MMLFSLSSVILTLLLLSFTDPVLNVNARPIRVLHRQAPWPQRNMANMHRMRMSSKNSRRQPASCPPLLPVDPVSRIIGGERSASLSPYLAGLFLAYGTGNSASLFFVCTGVMISPRWLVTAANCGISEGFMAVLGGDKASSGQRIRVAETYIPKQSGPKHFPFDRDIAFVKLANPAPKGIMFMAVNTLTGVPRTGAGARVAGYGLSEYVKNPAAAVFDEILRQVDVPVLSQEDCRKRFALATPPVSVSEGMLCAGVPGCGPCQADSGGPLLQFDREGRPVLIGIVSASVRCAEKFPTIFTRVSSFVPFMKKRGVEFTRAEGATQVGGVSKSASQESLAPGQSQRKGRASRKAQGRGNVQAQTRFSKRLIM